jgi:hypothetical protein
MIRIQRLKEPKVTSGKRLDRGDTYMLQGVSIHNTNKFSIYVDTFERKKTPPKKPKKSKKIDL